MGCVLALYDCRSKQEYIYRTNRMAEISGGSALLADLFSDFFGGNHGFDIAVDWRGHLDLKGDFISDFEKSGLDGELLYEGGGNLFVIFRSRDVYVEINKALSRYVIDRTYSVSIIASCVDVTGNFNADRELLYAENTFRKNQEMFLVPDNVLPFTQLDRLTYMPIVEKGRREYTMESLRKKNKYLEMPDKTRLLDDMTESNKSLLAVIYIDGNAMGNKLAAVTKNVESYSEGVSVLRKFSCRTNDSFVNEPLRAINNYLEEKRKKHPENKNRYTCRKVIGGGDEITLVCSAFIVPGILETYFRTLGASEGNSACAGVALFHSHAPFSEVYKIAEECCESGKERAHKPENAGKSYIDFHFCHGGITNDLDTLRYEQGISTVPYEVGDEWDEFISFGKRLSLLPRGKIKDLGLAAMRGRSDYRIKLAEVLSRADVIEAPRDKEALDKQMRMVSDAASVMDLSWFGEDQE